MGSLLALFIHLLHILFCPHYSVSMFFLSPDYSLSYIQALEFKINKETSTTENMEYIPRYFDSEICVYLFLSSPQFSELCQHHSRSGAAVTNFNFPPRYQKVPINV